MIFIFYFLICFIYLAEISSNKLSSIVIPFHESQLGKLEKNLATWGQFIPSKSIKVSLIFFGSSFYDTKLTTRIHQFLNNILNSSMFFTSIAFKFANLSDDKNNHYIGSRYMFELMLKKRIFDSEVYNVFYMEPDCFPIKSYWIEALNDEISRSKDRFWMKGSRYNDLPIGNNFPKFRTQHINGNALYNVAEKDFEKFYNEFIMPSFTDKNIWNNAYDSKLFEKLYEKNETLFKEYGKFFQFTDVIYNSAKNIKIKNILRKCSNTFLIHNGHSLKIES